MRDLANNIAIVQAVAPQVLSASITSDPVDTLGFDSIALAVETGAIVGAGDFTAKLQHSDTPTSGDFTDVPAVDLVGGLPASLAASAVAKVGYIGWKRFVRLVITKNGGTSIAAGCVAVKGNAARRPVAA
jgi:hypothetical protein